MIAAIEVVSKIEVEIIDGDFMINGTDVAMGMSPNMDIRSFFDENDFPNEQGCEVITRTLVSAISGNIHMAHQCGYIDSAKHLRMVIEQLQEMFVLNPRLEYVDEKEVKNG